MGHFKRGRPKNRRAGCLLCHPNKANGQKARVRNSPQETSAKLSESEQVFNIYTDYWAFDYDYDDDGHWDGPCSDSSCPECFWEENLAEARLTEPLWKLGDLFKRLSVP